MEQRDASVPTIEELNAMPAQAFASALQPLFEGASGFLSRLAEERPFDSDGEMIAAARRIARQLPEEEQRALLDAHPRIGADPASVSAMSRSEQGIESDDDAPRGEEDWIADELAMLNDVYEERFGFRYVVFVAGRARRDIIPLLERALHADRDQELRRGLDDVMEVAADRLRTLRGIGGEASA